MTKLRAGSSCFKANLLLAGPALYGIHGAQALREKHSNIKIIFCADNDCYHENGINPGIEKAREAAQAVGAEVVFPKFKDCSTHPTDFNDLMLLEGKDAVKSTIEQFLTQKKPTEQAKPVENLCSDPEVPDGFVLSDEVYSVSIRSNRQQKFRITSR